MTEKGSAAILGFFTVFVVISSLVAVYLFEAGYSASVRAMERRIATDAVRAMLKSVEKELNQTLKTSIEAAMYETGRVGGEKESVIRITREYLNQRISAGWDYHNFDIEVPLSDENNLTLTWLPDGSLEAIGYLSSTVMHISGVKGFGCKLSAGVVPRYGRMLHLATRAYNEAAAQENLQDFQNELQEKYACELFTFIIENDAGMIRVTVRDDYAGEALA